MFWPCPTEGHPGTPRLFEGGRFVHRRRPGAVPPGPLPAAAEVVDDEYPIWLTTGRVVSQYLSGTQTRRIGPLVDAVPRAAVRDAPAPRRPSSASPTATSSASRSRRGSMTLPANVVATIRPDTVFIPYHWPGRQAANQLTNRALDPISKIPEYKVSRGARRARRSGAAGGRRPARHGAARQAEES